MSLAQTKFIKPDRPFVWDYCDNDLAPLFRRRFTIHRFTRAEVLLCALGFGVFYINGQPLTRDLFLSPTSNYNKTLWYNHYDVTHLLNAGENVIACILGNGWYNESLKSVWEFREADWRDNPKLTLILMLDGCVVLETDQQWRCKSESWITFNQLRSGEHADIRLYEKNWNQMGYDDSKWEMVKIDDHPPRGVMRESICPPVRECAIYHCVSVQQTGEKRYLFDLGQNISGYVRLRVHQKKGDVLRIQYAEQVDEKGERKENGMPAFFPLSPFQTDILTLGSEQVEYSPMFTYHGFRFIEITGLDFADSSMVDGVFTHLDVEQIGQFECSNKDLNELFRLGVMSCYSNMQYTLTDCPTREKFGWLNDAKASCENLIMNFNLNKFFIKWFQDILDCVRDSDGAVSGIAPTSGCEYDSFTGPICSGVIHEIAYKMYLYTGDNSLLILGLPSMLHHLQYLKRKEDDDGLIGFGLYDWAGPFDNGFCSSAPTPVKFTDSALYIEFLQRTIFAAKVAGQKETEIVLVGECERVAAAFRRQYLGVDGYCSVNEQTAVSMMIQLGLYDDLVPLKEQLKACVEDKNFHMYCGMLGIRYLYDALNTCHLSEYAYRVITADGFPSYTQWLRQGATTLWETFYDGASKNHHMYSGFMLFLMDTLVGIRPIKEHPGMRHVELKPTFIKELQFCKGSRKMQYGILRVEWQREADCIKLSVDVPEGVMCQFRAKVLAVGHNEMLIKE